MPIPTSILAADWRLQQELDALRRVDDVHRRLDDKLQTMTRDLRGHRLYPQQGEPKRLRVKVLYSYTMPVEDEEDKPGKPGKWTLRVEAVDASVGKSSVVNFANCFRKCVFELDPRVYSDSNIEWTSFKKPGQTVDGIEVSRMGQTPNTVRVQLFPVSSTEKFSLSDELKKILSPNLGDAETHSKRAIVFAIWEYIKHHNLIKDDDCRVVVCDHALGSLLHCISIPFSSIVAALTPHLTPVRSVSMEFALPLDKACEQEVLEERIVDVEFGGASSSSSIGTGGVDALSKTRSAALAEVDDLETDMEKEMDLLKRQEEELVGRLGEVQQKMEWMDEMSSDPCGFLRDVEKSQQADQQILTAEVEADEFSIPHPQQFSQPWVRDVVTDLLANSGR